MLRFSNSNLTFFVCVLFLISSLSGCINEQEIIDDTEIDQEILPINSLTIAIEVNSEIDDLTTNSQLFADTLSSIMNYDVSIELLDSESAILESLRFGNADVALMDSGNAWMGWKEYGLEVVAADQKTDGRTYYNAHAWVLNDSEIAAAHLDDDSMTDPFSLMSGKKSCHTGWLDSTGMMVPMGFLLGMGYANIYGNPNDVDSLRSTIYGFFSEESMIPDPGSQYFGYSGALRCLSEGLGDVAFVKDNSLDEICFSEKDESWCLDEERYVRLPAFSKVPSDALIHNPSFSNSSLISDTVNGLINMSSEPQFSSLFSSVMNTKGLVSTNSDDHLGYYSEIVSHLPGMLSYFTDNTDGDEITLSIEELRIALIENESVLNTESDPSLLENYLEDKLRINVSLVFVESEAEKIASIVNDNADISFSSPQYSWVGWKEFNLSIMGAIENFDQRSFHYSTAWVKSDDEIGIAQLDDNESTNPLDLLRNKTTCNFDLNEDLSIVYPISKLVSMGYIHPPNSSEEISYFQILPSNSSNISLSESSFNPIQCLSEGYGDIAFSTDSNVDLYCNNEDPEDNYFWCLDFDEYVPLDNFGLIPSSSIMYNPSNLDSRSRTTIMNALLSLNFQLYLENYSIRGGVYTGCYDLSTHKIDSEVSKMMCGDEILKNVFLSTGIIRISTQDHLGSFSEVMKIIPFVFENYSEDVENFLISD